MKAFLKNEFCFCREKKVIDLEKPLLTGAFVDPSKVTQYTEKDYILPEIPPFSWLIKNQKVREKLFLKFSKSKVLAFLRFFFEIFEKKIIEIRAIFEKHFLFSKIEGNQNRGGSK